MCIYMFVARWANQLSIRSSWSQGECHHWEWNDGWMESWNEKKLEWELLKSLLPKAVYDVVMACDLKRLQVLKLPLVSIEKSQECHSTNTSLQDCSDVKMVVLLEWKKLFKFHCLSHATCALEELVGLQSLHSGLDVVYWCNGICLFNSFEF